LRLSSLIIVVMFQIDHEMLVFSWDGNDISKYNVLHEVTVLSSQGS
jgi:hypothetical protein